MRPEDRWFPDEILGGCVIKRTAFDRAWRKLTWDCRKETFWRKLRALWHGTTPLDLNRCIILGTPMVYPDPYRKWFLSDE